EERGLKNLPLDCDDPILILEQRILDVPTPPGELFRRVLQMNRTLVHGAFVLDEAGKSILQHDTLALADIDLSEVQGTTDAFVLAHPEMLTEVRYIPMPDGEEPELVLSIPAVHCLLDWGVTQAYFTDMPRIAALRKTLQSVEQGQPHPMIRHIE